MLPVFVRHIGFPRGWEIKHSKPVVPSLGKSHRHGIISHHRSLLPFLPALFLPKSGPHLALPSAWLIICLAPISIIPFPPYSVPSLCQILMCAQFFPVPIASPELRGDRTCLSSYPVMSHVCRPARKEWGGLGLRVGEGKGFSLVRKWAEGGVGVVWEH